MVKSRKGNASKYVKGHSKIHEKGFLALLRVGGRGGDKRVTRKATRRLKYDFFHHCTHVVCQQKTTARAQLQHKHINERVTLHLHQEKLS